MRSGSYKKSQRNLVFSFTDLTSFGIVSFKGRTTGGKMKTSILIIIQQFSIPPVLILNREEVK